MQHRLDARRAILMALALPVRLLQVPDRRDDARADRRRQRGGEDEARRIGAHRVDHVLARRDVAAEAAERLGERAFEHVDAMHLPFARADAAAARAVHADRMHLVAIGHRAVLSRRDRRSPSPARRRHPSSRGPRTRSASAARAAARRATLRDAPMSLWRQICFLARRTGARPRSSNCGSRHRTGSGNPAAASRWSRCRSGSRRSPR